MQLYLKKGPLLKLILKRKKRSTDSGVPKNINKMASLTRFISRLRKHGNQRIQFPYQLKKSRQIFACAISILVRPGEIIFI